MRGAIVETHCRLCLAHRIGERAAAGDDDRAPSASAERRQPRLKMRLERMTAAEFENGEHAVHAINRSRCANRPGQHGGTEQMRDERRERPLNVRRPPERRSFRSSYRRESRTLGESIRTRPFVRNGSTGVSQDCSGAATRVKIRAKIIKWSEAAHFRLGLGPAEFPQSGFGLFG